MGFRVVAGAEEREKGFYLSQQSQYLEAPAVDLEGRRAREAVEAVAEGVEDVEEDLRHGGRGRCGEARIRLWQGFRAPVIWLLEMVVPSCSTGFIGWKCEGSSNRRFYQSAGTGEWEWEERLNDKEVFGQFVSRSSSLNCGISGRSDRCWVSWEGLINLKVERRQVS